MIGKGGMTSQRAPTPARVFGIFLPLAVVASELIKIPDQILFVRLHVPEVKTVKHPEMPLRYSDVGGDRLANNRYLPLSREVTCKTQLLSKGPPGVGDGGSVGSQDPNVDPVQVPHALKADLERLSCVAFLNSNKCLGLLASATAMAGLKVLVPSELYGRVVT